VTGGAFAELPGWRKLLITLGISLLSAMIFSLIGMLISYIFFQINIFSDQPAIDNLKNPDVIASYKIIQALGGHIGMFIVPSFICALLFSRRIYDFLSLRKISKPISLITLLLITLTSVPLINWMVEWNSRLVLPEFMKPIEIWMKQSEKDAEQITDAFLNVSTLSGLFVNLMVIAMLPAIGEELMFRGIVQRILVNSIGNYHAGILISAMLFSAIHMQFYGFLPRMMLGIYFGYMLYWSRTIWLPVIAHFINNASAVVFAFLLKENLTTFNPDSIGTQDENISIMLLSVLLTAMLLFHLYRTEKIQNNRTSN